MKDRENDSHSSLTKHVFCFQKDDIRYKKNVWKLEPFSGVEIHMEMDMEWKWSGNGAQFVKIVWIGLDLGQSVDLKPYDRYRTFTKHYKSNTETRSYLID